MAEVENEEQQEPTMEEILVSIRRIISEEEEPGDGNGKDVAGEEDAEPSEWGLDEGGVDDGGAQEEDDILILTDEVQEEEPQPEPEPENAVIDTPREPLGDNVGLELISDDPAAEATESLAEFASAVAVSRGLPLGHANKTLEDIVKESLRPMLREWLDENLPQLVDRLVQREIGKLAGEVGKE